MCDTPAPTALLLCDKAPQRPLHAPLSLHCNLYDLCCVLCPSPLAYTLHGSRLDFFHHPTGAAGEALHGLGMALVASL